MSENQIDRFSFFLLFDFLTAGTTVGYAMFGHWPTQLWLW